MIIREDGNMSERRSSVIDFLEKVKRMLIDNFQISLRAVRLLMGYSAEKMCGLVGMDFQTLDNLETGRTAMSAVEFLAFGVVVSDYLRTNGEMRRPLAVVLGSAQTAVETSDGCDASTTLSSWFELNRGAELSVTEDAQRETEILTSMKLLDDRWVFADDTFLLSDYAPRFLHAWVRRLPGRTGKLIIPVRAAERIMASAGCAGYAGKAGRALSLLNWMQEKDIVQIRGEEEDGDLTGTILKVFEKFGSTHPLFLITGDDVFAREVLRLNDTAKPETVVKAGYLDGNGALVPYMDAAKWLEYGAEENSLSGMHDEERLKGSGFVSAQEKEPTDQRAQSKEADEKNSAGSLECEGECESVTDSRQIMSASGPVSAEEASWTGGGSIPGVGISWDEAGIDPVELPDPVELDPADIIWECTWMEDYPGEESEEPEEQVVDLSKLTTITWEEL